MTFMARRWTAIVLTVLAAALLAWGMIAAYGSLHDAAYFSGWVLLGMMLFLTAYNLRKKLPYPPLLRSSTWLQLHIYVGWLTVFLFPIHIGLRVPNGPFEVTLSLLFVAVVISGIVGLVLSRASPRRLSIQGEEVLFERIPAFRRELRQQAEGIVVRSVEQAQAMTLADFYRSALADFFHGPRHTLWHLCQSSRPLRRIRNDLRSLHRYLNESERQAADELRQLVEAKDGLDYHYAMQGALKLWLFVHIPLTYVLLIFAIVHTVLVHTFVRAGA